MNNIHEEYAHSRHHYASKFENAVDKIALLASFRPGKEDAGKLLKRCGQTQDHKDKKKSPTERAKYPNTADTCLMLRTYAFERIGKTGK